MDRASWRLAKDVIGEALRLPAAEREEFVRQRCSDAAVCDAVLALLEDSQTLNELWPSLQKHSSALELDDDDEIQPGTRIGPYTILASIGRGGMGHVFLGNDPRLRRKVALKCLIRSGAGNERQRLSVLHEARAAARVGHPNVATVHDILEHGDRAFIVMEYVEGENLAALLRRKRLTIEDVLAIGRQLASALTAAHAVGVVHRDLKPANIQIARDGTAKILDFGIANAGLFAASSVASDAQTRAGVTVRAPAIRMMHAGTPPYMSPEQLGGLHVDERSDIYSLGVVLFEMATGRRPYDSADPDALMHAQRQPAPRADALNPQLPRSVADLIANALEVNPARRPQHARDVAASLKTVQQRESIAGRLWRRRWPVAAGMPAALIAVLILGQLKTIAFNNTFGRTGPFARFGEESWLSLLAWGVRGLLPKLFFMAVATASLMMARVLWKGLESIGPIGRVSRGVRAVRQNLATQMGLHKPGLLAQAWAGVGIVLIVAVARMHLALLNAWTVSFDSAPIDMLMPMRESAPERGNYQVELSIVTLILGYGLYRVIQLRKRDATREGTAGIAMLIGVTAVAFLMADLPYRSFNHREFERATLSGARCYITGESGDEVLVLCPSIDPPRNRAVKRADPALRRLGSTENVFRALNPIDSHP